MVDYGSGGRLSTDEGSTGQRCLSDDSLVEVRSCGQVENGTPSTSPPYWDTDDDEDDGGPKPSALYGKFTWKIEKFSQINKRELRSNAFEVGGYKWYILIYPQGCDVCNHLSLFLCVANHDKLLPGWSHFAQFTIAVVNKDPKKSKYSDTLHRFWKKEHDWGWKKFIELSKVLDGFINDDSLVIKAQVQVIREKAHRPFRCLDCQYRRELVRVYLSNVEQICRRSIEDRKGKFSKLIEDKVRWSSFRAFWLGIDHLSRRRMTRDKTEAILKEVVKHFFVEKEVTSTLVMDSLYSGLKSLECQSKNRKGKAKLVEGEELPVPIVHIDNQMFVLADDILLLLERVALGPVPLQPLTPKDDKGSQNRTKEGSSGDEFNKDSIERDERRLTEFGRKTLEFFVLAHIFSRIDVAYQEAVALKRQEELIREEEAAEQAEMELKAKRIALDKEKRLKKKQAKQRRNNRKVKDRGGNEKPDITILEKQEHSPSDESLLEELSSKQEHDQQATMEKFGCPGNTSDTSETGDDAAENSEDRDCSAINWDADASEIHRTAEGSLFAVLNGQSEKRTTSIVDDSSSTCSTDSTPSVVMNGSYKGNSVQHSSSQIPSHGVKSQRGKDMHNRQSDAGHHGAASGNCRSRRAEPEAIDRRPPGQNLVAKEEIISRRKDLNQVDVEPPSNSRALDTPTTPGAPRKPSYVLLQQPKKSTGNASGNPTITSRATNIIVEATTARETHSSSSVLSTTPVRPATSSLQVSSTKSEAEKHPIATKSTGSQKTTSISRPLSAPVIQAPRPTVSAVSTVQTAALLSRSASAAGRLSNDPSVSAAPFIPHSYRNAITGKNDVSASQAFESSVAAPPSQATCRQDVLTFGSVKLQAPQSENQARYDRSSLKPSNGIISSSSGTHAPRLVAGIRGMAISSELQERKQTSAGVSSSIPSYPVPPGMVSDEFPHLDIINDLLDEDKNIARTAANLQFHHPHHQNNTHNLFNRHYSFPGDIEMGSFSGSVHLDQIEQCYNDGGFQGMYASPSRSPLRGLRDGQPLQSDLSVYSNGHHQGLIQNQWPYSTSDLSMLSLGSTVDAGNGYAYQLPDFSNRVNRYMYTRPGNGL